MRTRWVGITFVAIAALGIVLYKEHVIHSATVQTAHAVPPGKPEIILIADFRESGTEDNCAEIIRLVRAAASRGAAVQELSPDSEFRILKRYRVLTVPTVLILDRDGSVVFRYEGEEELTVREIRDKLASLGETKR